MTFVIGFVFPIKIDDVFRFLSLWDFIIWSFHFWTSSCWEFMNLDCILTFQIKYLWQTNY